MPRIPHPLELAVRRGDVAAIQAHLDAGGSPNEKWYEAGSLLHIAALYSQIEVIDLLLKAGADLEAGARLGKRPLMFACGIGSLPAVKRLLDAGAAVDGTSYADEMAIHNACFGKGDLETRKAIIRLLIERGATVETRCGQRFTPLLYANRPEIADFLIEEFGADPKALAYFGRNGLFAAANVDIARWWVEKQGIDVNSRDEYGDTPLNSATMGCRADVMAYLINQGADIEAVGQFGRRPIHIAASNPHGLASPALVLIQAGADTVAEPLPHDFAYSFKSCEEAIAMCLTKAAWEHVIDPTVPIRLGSAFSRYCVATRVLRWILASPLLLESVAGWRARVAAAKEEKKKEKERLEKEVEDDDEDDEEEEPAEILSRDERLSVLRCSAWEKRKHLVCFYVLERRKMKAGAGGSESAKKLKC